MNNLIIVIYKEIKAAIADDTRNSKKSLVFALGALRNLSIGDESIKIQMVENGIGDTMIAICWLCESEPREKALGTLWNLTASQVASKLLIKSGEFPRRIGTFVLEPRCNTVLSVRAYPAFVVCRFCCFSSGTDYVCFITV